MLARAEALPAGDPSAGLGRAGPEDWWRASETALAEVGAAKASQASGSQARCTDSSRSTTPTASSPSDPLNDQRTEECAEIEERFGLRELVQLTGNRALPGFTAPKLLWLRKHEPDVYARIGHVLCRRTTCGCG